MTSTHNHKMTTGRRITAAVFTGAAAALIGLAAAGTASANPSTPVTPTGPGTHQGPRVQTHIPVAPIAGEKPGGCAQNWGSDNKYPTCPVNLDNAPVGTPVR